MPGSGGGRARHKWREKVKGFERKYRNRQARRNKDYKEAADE